MRRTAWWKRRAPRLTARVHRARVRVIDGIVRRRFGRGELADDLVAAAVVPVAGRALLETLLRDATLARGAAAADAGVEAALARLVRRRAARDRLALAHAATLEQGGSIHRALALLPVGPRGEPARARLAARARLLADGMSVSPRAPRAIEPVPRRILYHSSQGLPHHSTGYAIRTHWLVRALRRKGWDVEVHTRFGYPDDRHDFQRAPPASSSAEIDGVPYRMTPVRRGIGALDTEAYQAAAAAALVRQAEAFRPAVIHSASNHAVGLAGAEAARKLGLPSIYEVRGLWHHTVASTQPAYLGSDHFRMIEKLEASAASASDHVFAITGAIRDVLIGHGVAPGKISVLPNAVEPDEFAPRERDPALARALGLGDAPVIGYIGSLKRFEGLDLLLQAAAALRARADFRLLFVGDGPAEAELRALSARLGLDDLAVFAGRQPHARIRDHYSLVDVMPFPRTGIPLCEIVSPLKPFEAMSMARAVIVSDVAALAEIVQHGVTGLVHRKDDVGSLTAALEECITRPDLRRELGAAARAWIIAHGSWSRVTTDIEAIYRSL